MKRRANKRRWSGQVTRHSNALDLEPGVFKQRSPRSIARSLKRSADASNPRGIAEGLTYLDLSKTGVEVGAWVLVNAGAY